ncbi:MAG TPA: ATP-binding protein [Isosphaeraceae bacterium]|nr:ATP-binding protein [Isosphaeraceae bacterium]
MIDALAVALLASDGSCLIRHANPAAERLLGYDLAALLGRELASLWPEEHRQGRDPRSITGPTRLPVCRPDGSRLHVEWLHSEVGNGDGVGLYVTALRDAAETIILESRLAALGRLAARLGARHDPGQVLALAIESLTTDFGATFARAWSLDPESGQLLARAWGGRAATTAPPRDRLDPASDPGPVAEALRLAAVVTRSELGADSGHDPSWLARSGIVALVALPLRLGGASLGVLEVLTGATVAAEGLDAMTALAGLVAGALGDAEQPPSEHRALLQDERAERAAQFKALLDHLPVGVAYFDADCTCRAANGPARRILGRPRGEVLGASCDALFARAPGLGAAVRRCVDERLPHVEPGVAWADPTDAPGRPRIYDWQFQPLPPERSGRSLGALALIVDATDRARAEDELQRSRDAAEQASSRKTQFLSAVSHDLRTPVNALSLQVDLLGHLVGDREGADRELSRLVADLRHASANLVELLNDLLDLTRFDSGQLRFHAEDFALEEWLAATLGPLEPTARAKGLAFSWRVDRPGRVVRADRVKLGRVLTNLVGNAIKFTEAGSVAVEAGADASGWLRLSVADTGPGIPDDQRERIFDEFAQLRNPERDRSKGTGLGLAICRRLVESVGGWLVLESVPGAGSTFVVLFPPDHLPAVAAPAPAAGPEPPPAPVQPEPILIVEDDQISRQALARLLGRAGHTVVTAANGAEALELLDSTRPSLALLDLMLPGMDGLELLRRIRERPGLASMPVVVLSGDVSDERLEHADTLGIAGILSKPIELERLLATLARLLPPKPGS